jgi:hypothetical protein
MLDEYIKNNDQSFKMLYHGIKVKNKYAAEQALKVLMQNAQILSADNLIALCL